MAAVLGGASASWRPRSEAANSSYGAAGAVGSQPLHWVARPFAGLGVESLYAAMQLRQRVFVLEQHCAYLDADGLDTHCWHLLGWSAPGKLAAYLRIVPPGLKYAEASIGRVVTAPEQRGEGLGRELVGRGLERCSHLHAARGIRISAQAHLQAFYGHFGFATQSDVYLEDDIPHVEMLRPPQPR